jgi:hypothetical protein
MKLDELTFQQFLDAITQNENNIEFTLTPIGQHSDDDVLTMNGTRSELICSIQKSDFADVQKEKYIKYINNINTGFDPDISDIAIFNYLEKITSNFNPEKIKIVLFEMNVYYDIVFLERIDSECHNIYNENQWERPQRKELNRRTGEEYIIDDYEKMRAKTHPFDGWNIERAISLLKKKLSENEAKQINSDMQTLKIKSYFDLTLLEFLELISNVEHVYEFVIPKSEKEEETIVRGTLNQILNKVYLTNASIAVKEWTLKTVRKMSESTYSKELNDVEIYSYIERATGNFDKEKTRIILNDIEINEHMFSANLEYESEQIYKKNNWEIPYLEEVAGTCTAEIINGYKVKFQDYHEMIARTHPFALYDINQLISLLKRKLNDISNNQQNKKSKLTKPELTFSGLFKPEYVIKVDQLITLLKQTGYIDQNKIWRDNETKNEPAKIYFWLLDKGVLKPHNKPTPALKCFCKEFGVIAYSDNEPTPPPEQRAVAVRGLLNTHSSPDEKWKFDRNFLSFLSQK